MALVAGQDVEPGDDDGTWRIAQRVAPDRVISTVDPEARHMHKSRSEYRDGYKAHVAVEPETGLITATALTPANAGDGPTGVELLDGEAPGLQVLADSAYGSGEVRVALRDADTTGDQSDPVRAEPVPGGFDRDDFIIDHPARTATCPAGHTVTHHHQGPRDVRGPLPWLPARDRAAPPRRTDAPCTSTTTTPNSSKPAAPGTTATSPTTTANGGPWSNDPSPGSSPAATAASATAASNATNSASPLRVAAINLRRLVNLGLTRTESTWTLATSR